MKMTFIKQVFAVKHSKANQPIKATKLLRVITAIANQLSRIVSAINALTPILATSRLKSAIAMFLALTLVACAAGGGGGGAAGGGTPPPTVPLSAFSHSSYTFAPAINGSQEITELSESVGRVFANPVRISEAVASRLADVSAHDILTAGAAAYYNLSFHLNNDGDDENSIVNNYFIIDEETGEINVLELNPNDSNLTFDEIRAELSDNSISVRIEIVPASGEGFTPITSAVNVQVLNLAARIAAGLDGSKAFLSYELAGITARAGSALGNASFATEGAVDEGNDVGDDLYFNRFNDSKNQINAPIGRDAFNIAYANASAPQVTLFYGLVDNTNTAALTGAAPTCGDGTIYLDNIGMTLKAGRELNFEARNAYSCRLVVSTDGLEYRPLSFIVDSNINVSDNSPNLISSNIDAIRNDVYLVSQASNQSISCTNGQCYYGDISIAVSDVNEAPTITLTNQSNDLAVESFAPVAEGIGPDAEYAAVAGTPIRGVLASGNLANSAIVTIADEDFDQEGVNPDDVAIRVLPNHRIGGVPIADAFTINPATPNSRTSYQLTVNATMLDYESFTPAQLTADASAIYQITITTKDNRSNSLTSGETFNLEVTDVQYNPVFVNPAGTPVAPIGTNQNENTGAAAFARSDNLLTADDGSLLLLSDIRAFYRNIIGAYAAVDPETLKDENFIYSIVNNDPITAIERNIALTSVSNERGRRLIVTGPGLREGNTATLTLRVANTLASVDASVSTNISLRVDNAAYQEILGDELTALNAPPSIFFNSAVPLIGDFEEGPYAANANPLISFGRVIPLNSTAAFSEFTTATGAIIDNDDLAPGFAFMDAASFNRIPTTLRSNLVAALGESGVNALIADTGTFAINANTGELIIQPDIEINFPATYRFAVFVTPTAADAEPEFIAGTSDLAIIELVATDNNTPPVATNTSGSLLDSSNTLTGRIEENQNAGTEIVSFIVTDDNLLLPDGTPEFSFAGASAATATGLLDIITSINGEVLTATIVTKRQLDFETEEHRTTLANLLINVTDGGEYTSVSATGEVLRGADNIRAIPATTKSIVFASSITLENAPNEPPQLRATPAPLGIMEDAAAGTTLQVATLGNPTDFPDANGNFDSESITLRLTGRFQGILRPAFDPANDGAILLEVVNAPRLENLGDNRTFPATITATATGQAAASITVNIRIIDAPANSQISQAVLDDIVNRLNILNTQGISEQDVAGNNNVYRIPAEVFSFVRNDLAKDADELSAAELGLAIVYDTVANNASLNPGFDNPSILSLVENAGIYTLQINDADFVEDNLFGDLEYTLAAHSVGNTQLIASQSITINPAEDKSIAYATPVTAATYTQTGYAPKVAAFEGDTIATIGANTLFNTDAIVGVAATFINITDEADTTGDAYRTVTLTDVAGSRNRFIARNDPRAFTAEIRFTGDVDVTDAANLDILTLGADNTLVDARAEFNRYFSLAVNTQASPSQLAITQKTFSYTDNGGTPDDDSDDVERQYNALDTLQLYAGATGGHSFNYFIRAKTTDAPADNSDASRYALAQFSVAVEAPGIQGPIRVTRIALVPSGNGFDSGASNAQVLNITTDGNRFVIAENAFTPNTFDAWDLLVEFTNPDALTNIEGTSLIEISIADGSIIGTGVDNTASGDSLMALRLSPNNSDVTIADGQQIFPQPSAGLDVVDVVSPSFATIANQVYTASYNLALALNLAGSATFTISVTDRDLSGNNIGPAIQQDFTLEVTPAAPILGDDITITATAAGSTANIHGPSIKEDGVDASPFVAGPIDISPQVISIAGEPIGVSALEVILTGVSGDGGNGANAPFITHLAGGGNRISYLEHGQGTHSFNYAVTIREPRGFSETPATYNVVAAEEVRVANTEDPTSYSATGSSITNFQTSDFATNDEFDENKATQPNPNPGQTLVFADADLLFDTLESALGTTLVNVASTPAITGGANLAFTPTGVYTLAAGPRAGTAQASIEYSLSLDEDSWDALGEAAQTAEDNNQPPPNFGLTFTFNGVELPGSVPVTFSLERASATLTGTPPAEGAIIEIDEETSMQALTQTVTFTDADIRFTPGAGRNLATDYDFRVSGPDFITPAINRVEETNNGLARFLIGTVDDKDVGVDHSVSWSLIDNDPAAGATLNDEGEHVVASGSFKVRVNPVADAPTNLRVNAPANPTAAERTININTGKAATIDLQVLVNDNDLLQQDGVVTSASVDYDGASIWLDQLGTPATDDDIECVLAAGVVRDLFAAAPSVNQNDDEATITGSLSLTFGLNSNPTLGTAELSGNSDCQNIAIGSTINRAVFRAMRVAVPDTEDPTGFTSSPTINFPTGSAAYVVQGYRRQQPSITAPATFSVAGATNNLMITLTDTDSDDGYFKNYPAGANIVRDDSIGAEWGATTAALGAGCTGITIVQPTTFNAVTISDTTATATQRLELIATAAASGSCNLTLSSVGEDGVAPESRQVVITAQRAASVAVVTTPALRNFIEGYDSGFIDLLSLTWQVTDGDADSNEISYNYSIAATSATICALTTARPPVAATPAGTEDRSAPFSVTRDLQILPLRVGDCLIEITATEDGVTSAITSDSTFTINIPELAPALSRLLNENGSDADKDDFTLPLVSGPRVLKTTISSIDNDGKDIQVMSTAFPSNICTLSINSTSAKPGSIISTGGATNSNGGVTNSTGGVTNSTGGVTSPNGVFTNSTFTLPDAGGEIIITFTPIAEGFCRASVWAEEDGKRLDILAAASYSVIAQVQVDPIVSQDFLGINSFTAEDATTPITYTGEISSGDPDDSPISVLIFNFFKDICTVTASSTSSTGAPAESIQLPSSGGEVTITITPLKPGVCLFNAVAFEDGVQSPIINSLRVTFPEPTPGAPPPEPTYTAVTAGIGLELISPLALPLPPALPQLAPPLLLPPLRLPPPLLLPPLISPLVAAGYTAELFAELYTRGLDGYYKLGLGAYYKLGLGAASPSNASAAFRTLPHFISIAATGVNNISGGVTLTANVCHLANLTQAQDLSIPELTCDSATATNFTDFATSRMLDLSTAPANVFGGSSGDNASTSAATAGDAANDNAISVASRSECSFIFYSNISDCLIVEDGTNLITAVKDTLNPDVSSSDAGNMPGHGKTSVLLTADRPADDPIPLTIQHYLPAAYDDAEPTQIGDALYLIEIHPVANTSGEPLGNPLRLLIQAPATP